MRRRTCGDLRLRVERAVAVAAREHRVGCLLYEICPFAAFFLRSSSYNEYRQIQ
jgi:hypothetical protein